MGEEICGMMVTMADDESWVDDVEAALAATVHVHETREGDEPFYDLFIYRNEASMSVRLSRGEVSVLILAVSTSVEHVAVEVGSIVVHVHADLGDPPPPALKVGATASHVTIGLAYAGSDIMSAMIVRNVLLDLLQNGCSSSKSRLPEKPSSKCN
jgi:hypothetical protein